jgi:LAS superfamily LD-carboxypeptidase LdcB
MEQSHAMKALSISLLFALTVLAILMRLDDPSRAYWSLSLPRARSDLSRLEFVDSRAANKTRSLAAGSKQAALLFNAQRDLGRSAAAGLEADFQDWGTVRDGASTQFGDAGMPVLMPARTPAVIIQKAAVEEPPPASIASAMDYLPPGARNESEALLTAIAPQVPVFAQPQLAAMPAPFTLHEGESVRPATRLRLESGFDWIQFERDGSLWWAPAELFVRLAPLPGDNHGPVVAYEIGREPVDRYTPLPADYVPPDLTAVNNAFVLGHKTILLRREAAAALESMLTAARREGFVILVFSGFRDFATQRKLYLDAMAKDGPKQNGTAAPGYSEHQLGTTVDVTNTNPAMILSSKFGDTAEGRWLFLHAAEFGFVHSYTEENSDEAGYKPEPWHLRYVGRDRAAEILSSRALLAAGGGG